MDDPIPADAIYGFSTVTDVAVAPDGDRVAFVVAENDGEEEVERAALHVAPTDGSRPPHRLTRASEASDPAWSPDGSTLGFLAARDRDLGRSAGPAGDGEDDEEPETQLWAFDLDRGGDARQLTDREEGVRGFDWGPDGDRVVVAARDPTEEEAEYLERRRDDGPIEVERLQHKTEASGWTDPVTSYLFVVDLEAGGERRLDDAYGSGAREPFVGLGPAWSPDGDRIAFVSNRTERPDDSAAMDVYAVPPEGGDADRLTDGDVVASDLDWSPDGERITFASWQPDNWYRPREVYVVDAAAGTYGTVSGDLDRTVSWFGAPRWLDGGTVVAGIADEGWVGLATLDADGGGAEPRLDALGRDRSVGPFDAAAETLVCTVRDPTDGSDLHAISRSDLDAPDRSALDDALVRLTALNGSFTGEWDPAPLHRVSTTHDDAEGDDDGPVTVESMVYTPPGFDPGDPEPRPLILWPHGGPMSYDGPEFSFPVMYFASRGYVVCKPNYRGSSSYGRAFCETLRGRWGSVEIVDQLAAVDDLVERGWADPDRLFMTGFSYGGISTGFAVTHTDRFAAAAPEHGIYDRRSSFATSDSHVWTSNELGVPWEEPAAYEENSSITDVDRIDTPLLVTAGGQDWRCPPTQAEQLYVSVRKRGVPAKLVVYPEEGHGVGDPDRAIHRLEELAGWFAEHDPGRD